MFYVYILQSILFPERHYVGYSEDLKSRVRAHNFGDSKHTKKYKPWKLVCYVGFSNMKTAKNMNSISKQALVGRL